MRMNSKFIVLPPLTVRPTPSITSPRDDSQCSSMICPPLSKLSQREALAIGALLQCKGLMEIVAATILRDKGLLSEHAFAALVTLAVLSTLLTGPLFRFVLRHRAEQRQADSLSR